ncbi:MAG: phosphoadenosine phosphosulfate reductase family protein, partial [Nitrospinota bacterium]
MSSAKKGMSLPEALERGDQVSPTAVLEGTLERFSPRVLMTTAFGLNGVALIHMTHALDPNLPVLFIDTDFHFPETLETKDRIVERYGLNLIEYRVPPPPEDQGEPSREWPSPETPELCCAERKVETFQRALTDLEPDALISARSQYQSE